MQLGVLSAVSPRGRWQSNSSRTSRKNARHSSTLSRPGPAPIASGICSELPQMQIFGLQSLSVGGIGAYDHVLRAAMLSRLEQMPDAKALIPFVMLSYSEPSTYDWVDDTWNRRTVSPWDQDITSREPHRISSPKGPELVESNPGLTA